VEKGCALAAPRVRARARWPSPHPTPPLHSLTKCDVVPPVVLVPVQGARPAAQGAVDVGRAQLPAERGCLPHARRAAAAAARPPPGADLFSGTGRGAWEGGV